MNFENVANKKRKMARFHEYLYHHIADLEVLSSFIGPQRAILQIYDAIPDFSVKT